MTFRILLLIVLAWATWPLAAHADFITLNADTVHSTSQLGSFTGTLQYEFTNAGHATLTVALTNTSPTSNGGFITGFVLNNPSNYVAGIGLSAPNASYSLIGTAPFQDGANGAPYGQFDFGAGLGGSFEGGGNPHPGIGVGASGTFTFALTGNHLDLLTGQDFVNALSTGPGEGKGAQFLVVRFRGFDHAVNGADSDKVPGSVGDPPTHHNPEPSTLLLGGVGAGLSLLCRIFRRRGRS